MKKRIILLLVLFSMILSGLFSANNTDTITVSLKTTSDKNYYEVGFASMPVPNYAVTPTVFAADYILPLTPADDASYASLSKDVSLYVYWKIYTLESVEIKLRARGALVNKVHNHVLPWTISWTYSNQQVSSYADQAFVPETQKGASMVNPGYKLLAKCPALISLQGIAGSVQLDIKTNSLLDPFPNLRNQDGTQQVSACYTDGTYDGYIDLMVNVV